MAWPWMRFEAMFKSHLLRMSKERLQRQCDLTLAAVNANSNYDDSSDQNIKAKRERIEAIEGATSEAIAFLYADDEDEDEDDPFSMENDPLFRDVRRMREAAQPPEMEQAGMGYDLLTA